MSKFINLVGEKFGILTVIERAANDKYGRAMWTCKCQCGNEVIVHGDSLRRGLTKSCGCNRSNLIKLNNTKHGEFGTRLYNIWGKMKHRCNNPNNKSYKNYGGRGITVCNEWAKDFRTFYNWAMANGYSEEMTIDRIDVNGNYEPSNCRWSTMKEQCNNKRNNLLITYKNETKTLEKWVEELGINYNLTWQRIYRDKWTVDRAFSWSV